MAELRRINETTLEVPVGYKPGMRVRGLIYVDEHLAEGIEAKCIDQVANVAMLPGIVRASMAMPDIHSGYGFAIGGVAAFDIEEGVVSPGGVGYDINCGVRLLRSNLRRGDVQDRLKSLAGMLFHAVPSGVGSKGRIKLGVEQEREVYVRGAKWAVGQGMGEQSDLERTESGGCLEGADPEQISARAAERGSAQIGTLGSGNHFLEIQHVDEIYDEQAANSLGREVRHRASGQGARVRPI
jgi:tRNA-splicing ligase RtcB